MVSMAPPEGEEEKTQAYYVIKAAQEKEELQRTGDQLDAKIRKAEKEIRALKNTVQLMNDRNSTYRKSFNNVEETSEEYEKKMQLEEQLRAAMDKLKYKKRQMKELQEDLRVMQATAESLTVDENELVVTMEEKQRTIDSLQKELDVQEEKKERADKMTRKVIRDVKGSSTASKKSKKGFEEGEADIKVRELRDFNNSLMKKLGLICRDYPDIAPVLTMYCQQSGLPVPPSPGPGSSRGSSTTGSVRSNLSSARSSVSSVRSDTSSARQSRQALGTVSVDLSLNAFASHSPLGTPPRSTASSRASSGKSTPSRTPSRSASASSNRTSPTKKTPTSKSNSRPPTGRSSAASSKR